MRKAAKEEVGIESAEPGQEESEDSEKDLSDDSDFDEAESSLKEDEEG